MKQIIDFLSELTINNNRDWFNANKPKYLEVRELFENFVDEIILNLQENDPSLKGLTAKKSVFRIYRDVRFSGDKSPYKTNFGAYMVGGGRKSGRSGFYIHLDPAESFIGGGLYQPEPQRLKAIRQEIFGYPDEFLAVLQKPEFSDSYNLYEKDKLKRPPKGYPADFEHVDLLKYKHYIASKIIPDEWIGKDNLLEKIVKEFRILCPLSEYLNRAMESESN